MLVFAFALVAFAFANVGFSLEGKLPSRTAEYMAAYIVIILIAHLAMRRLAPWADPLLLPLAALLNGLGIVMMYRLGAQVNPATGRPEISASATGIQILFSAIGKAASTPEFAAFAERISVDVRLSRTRREATETIAATVEREKNVVARKNIRV